jgi:hypothetical protein
VPKLFFGYATGATVLSVFRWRFIVSCFQTLRSGGFSGRLRSQADDPDQRADDDSADDIAPGVAAAGLVRRLSRHPPATALRSNCTSDGCVSSRVGTLDGLGTAEMWHIFISNRPGRHAGTLRTLCLD